MVWVWPYFGSRNEIQGAWGDNFGSLKLSTHESPFGSVMSKSVSKLVPLLSTPCIRGENQSSLSVAVHIFPFPLDFLTARDVEM